MKKIISLFVFVLLAVVLVGCESISGPEGKYFYINGGKEAASLNFESKEVTIKIDGVEKGKFSYKYEKNKDDKTVGTVTIESEEFPWVMVYKYEEKQLYYDYDGDKRLNVFIKSLAN